MIVLYVDDLGIAYSNLNDIEDFFAILAKIGFEFTREGSFTDFLGIKFEKNKANKTVMLMQKGLIQRIIAATGMEGCNPNWTPATQQALGINPGSEPMNETWSYPSIIGMLCTYPPTPASTLQWQSVKWHASTIRQRKVMQLLSKQLSATSIKLPTKEPSSPQVETCLWIAMSTLILLDFMVATQTVNLQVQSPALAT